jgi:hypothetical protein
MVGRVSGTVADRQRLLSQRVAELERRVERLVQQGGFRRGVVAATGSTTLTVTVDGQPVEVGRLTGYTPTLGDAVLVAVSPDGWVVIGKVA